MKNDFLLRKEFLNWLVTIGGFPVPSAKSYCSYVAAADKTIVIVHEENNDETNLFAELEPLVKKGQSLIASSKIIEIVNKLSEDKIDETLNAPKSSISKWRSALYQYLEFLYYYIETEIEPIAAVEADIETDIIEGVDSAGNNGITLTFDQSVGEAPSMKLIHSKPDVYANFRFRLITQDRFYDDIFYPISFIKRFFYLKGDKEFLDAWVNSLIDSVTIYIEDGSVKLNKVHKIEISEGRLHVYANGSTKLGYSKKSDNTTLIPFSVTGLHKVALDHEKPLLRIMLENLDNLKTFQEITKELKKHISRKVNPKKLKKAANLVLKSDFIHQIDIDQLKSELILLSSLTHLQLMDGNENKRKGATL